MDEVESLSSILESPFSKGEATPVADTAPPAVEQKVEPVVEAKTETPVEVETPSKPRDEAGRFKSEKAEEVDGRNVALREERERRRRAEAELNALREQKPKTDFFENPSQAVSETMEPLQRELINLKVELESVKNPDFKEAMMLVLERAAEDPILKHQIDTAPDPLKMIYREGKRLKELGPDGDVDKFKERVTGELKAELSKRDETIKTLSAQVEALTKAQKELESIPRSLNKGTESAPRVSDGEDDIASLTRFGKTG